MIRLSTFCLASFLFFVSSSLLAQSTFTAGFRASRIIEDQGPFPSADYWIHVGNEMAGRFSGASPAGIWIVSIYWSNGDIGVNFPSAGKQISHVYFNDVDENEAYLTKFDNTGLKMWLQIEPGSADIDTLMDLVMNRYKHHPCVVGFGIDVEWYKYDKTTKAGRNGQKVSDSIAQQWETHLHSINTNYTLFLKHFDLAWMPPTYRGKILLVDDSQGFPSLSSMASEFKTWGLTFLSNKVAFQFGYEADSLWWRRYSDPPKKIGDTLRTIIPNCYGVFWVDFTITKVFPLSVIDEMDIKSLPDRYMLSQNYPNPFNPTTTISYAVHHPSFVTLKVYNLLGKEVATLVNEHKESGYYKVPFDRLNLASGIFFYRLQVGTDSIIKKMVVLK
jgi:hypothetical protein